MPTYPGPEPPSLDIFRRPVRAFVFSGANWATKPPMVLGLAGMVVAFVSTGGSEAGPNTGRT